jgi:tetratricopeptide (TPR) repeat protein
MYDEAIEHYKRAIEINPKYEEAYNGLGITMDDLKRYN